MRADKLRRLAVVDPETACRIGSVTNYWIDPVAGRVAALAIRPVDVDLPQRVAANRVVHVGRDAVMLAAADGGRAPSVGPVPDHWLDRLQLSGLAVYTDTGDRLGRVAGARIDPASLAIEGYDLAKPWWRRWLPSTSCIAPASVAWCGRDVLVVRTTDPAKLRPAGQEEGVAYKLGRGAAGVNGQNGPGTKVGAHT